MNDHSTMYEDYNCDYNLDCHEHHANTYLEAKALGESCINLLNKRAGQPLHQKNVRIFRLATLGPAVEFPHPGWGAGWQGSPVSAIIATESVPEEMLRIMVPENGTLDGEFTLRPFDLSDHRLNNVQLSPLTLPATKSSL